MRAYLQELIKNTEKTARDLPALQRALEEMQDLSLYVNEVKRDNEALQLILDIQNSIVDLQMVSLSDIEDPCKNAEWNTLITRNF